MTSVRATSAELRERLGEPDRIEMDAVPSATIMRYRLAWSCGCSATGPANDYHCRPCGRHAATFSHAF